MNAKDTINLLIVHEDALMAAGLEAVLARSTSLRVQTCNALDVSEDLAERDVDVLVADYNSAAAWLRATAAHRPGRVGSTRVVIVTPLHREVDVRAALHAGASGYVRQSCQPEELLHAVFTVAGGVRYICPTVSGCLVDSFMHAELTSRETDVLRLMAMGLCNKAIANRLGISLGTVKAHVSAVLGKLRVQSRTEAIVRAAQRGLVEAVSTATGQESLHRGSQKWDRVVPTAARAMNIGRDLMAA